MQGGDLANTPEEPLIFVIWEGLIAVAGPKFTQKKFARRVRLHRHRAAVALMEPNEAAMSALWNLWADGRRVCVVTYLPPPLLPAIRRDLEKQSVPYARLMQISEHLMARTIVQRRDAQLVYDADPQRRLMYGLKGRIIRPDQAALMEKCL